MLISERIKAVRKYFNLTQEQLAESAGITRQAIYSLEAGKSKSISKHVAKYLADKLNISENWLVSGEGDMLNIYHVNEPTPEYKGTQKPFIPFPVQAGHISRIAAPIDLESKLVYIEEFQDCDFVVPVEGDSMFDTFRHGDRIAIKRVNWEHLIRWGEPYVVITKDHERLLKRVLPHDNKTLIILRSDNHSKYPNIEIEKSYIDSMWLVKGKVSTHTGNAN